MTKPYVYTGITKDNCLTDEKTHFVKDKNCVLNAFWYCTDGSNIQKVRGLYYIDEDNMPLYYDKSPVVVNDSYEFLAGKNASSVSGARIQIVPEGGTGVFTLKVREYYLPVQQRLL